MIGAATSSSRVVEGCQHLAHSYRRYEVALSSGIDPLSSPSIIQPPDLASKHVTSLWKWLRFRFNCRSGDQSRSRTGSIEGAGQVALSSGIDGNVMRAS
jgi:hypothetical protein